MSHVYLILLYLVLFLILFISAIFYIVDVSLSILQLCFYRRRLLLAQSTIVQQEWRVAELNFKIFNYLIPHLAHPYKNVRDRIGRFVLYKLVQELSFFSAIFQNIQYLKGQFAAQQIFGIPSKILTNWVPQSNILFFFNHFNHFFFNHFI